MATFQFNLVSPEELLFSQAVEQVDVPGSEGDFGVLANHAPLVAMVRPGILTIHGDGAPLQVVVSGGFAEVNPEGLTVLADFATPLDRFDRTQLASQIKDMEEDLADASDDGMRDRLREKLEQLRALNAAVG